MLFAGIVRTVQYITEKSTSKKKLTRIVQELGSSDKAYRFAHLYNKLSSFVTIFFFRLGVLFNTVINTFA